MNRLGALGMGLLATFAMSPAIADCSAGSCNNVRITKLYTTVDGDVYIQVSGNMGVLNCTLLSGTYITVPSTAPRFREIYASLLAYQLADHEISIRIVDGSAGCQLAYLSVTS